MVAVISGATGLVGSVLIRKLLQSPNFTRVISLGRRPLHLDSPKLTEVIVTNLDQMANHANELQGDVYFCCLGTTIKAAGSQDRFKKIDLDAVLAFGQLAKSHQAKSLVVISASGANESSSIFYNRVKGQMENGLRQLGLNRLVVFRPALLIGERSEFRIGEKIFMIALGLLSCCLPKSIDKRLRTSVELLASHMLAAGVDAAPGEQVIEAIDI